MSRLTFGQYSILTSDHFPLQHDIYLKHATLIEQKEDEETILVDVMGKKASFSLREGPPNTFRW